MKYNQRIFDDIWDVFQDYRDLNVITRPGDRRFLSLLKNLNQGDPLKSQVGKYWQTIGYVSNISGFINAFNQYQKEIEKERLEWNQQNDLEKLVCILKEIFYRNYNAHHCHKRFAKWRSFDKKSSLLYKAVNLAEKINLDGFLWGKQMDPKHPDHPVILYFQLGSDQVSFHCDGFENVRDFEGKWIGYPQERCPSFIQFLNKHHASVISQTNDRFPSSLDQIEIKNRIEKGIVHEKTDISELDIENEIRNLKPESELHDESKISKISQKITRQKTIYDFTNN